ncbi:malonyl-CoA synthase [Pararhodobacter sp. SW119]|uniref:malonate--CoA ligase n=1 Tax=Pararhodobacter sp. SW119 TaxID=2780075 RepID=UPI001ADEDC08|nr:malonyl-CoA synthase [Pararhodobacter sp. SW119]
MTNPLHEALIAPLRTRADPLLHLSDGASLSGFEFFAMCARAAGALRAAGLEPGDRVVVQAAKCPGTLAIYGGALAAGVVFLPLNTAYTPDEVAYFLQDSEAGLMIAEPAHAPALAPIVADCGTRLETLSSDGSGSFDALAAAQPDTFAPVARDPDDLAAILYTSGTTGRSKGAMLSQRNLLSNAEVLVQEWRFSDSDVLLHALPVFHTHGLFVATNVTLLVGGSMIFLPKFDADQVFEELPRATAMMGVPTFYTRLLEDPRLTRKMVEHVRLFVSGSAPLLAETHTAWEARTGHRILERYGMTETNMITSNPYEGERRAGTVGFPLPGIEVRLTDPATGAEVPAGETGMIEVRGPNVFRGYWRMPEKTAEELRENGFFITGDLGRFQPDGYLEIVGRQKDLIITGGFNVYPREIEDVLDAQPGVLESAVIGVPHPDFGEAVLAVLVPQAGATPDLNMIEADLRQRLAGFKRPKGFEIVPELPRNAMGKVQKAELRRQYGQMFKPAAAGSLGRRA